MRLLPAFSIRIPAPAENPLITSPFTALSPAAIWRPVLDGMFDPEIIMIGEELQPGCVVPSIISGSAIGGQRGRRNDRLRSRANSERYGIFAGCVIGVQDGLAERAGAGIQDIGNRIHRWHLPNLEGFEGRSSECSV